MSSTDARRLIAAALKSPEELLALLASEPHLIRERTEHLRETPLHYLAVENHLEAVKVLIEHGAEVNTVNECGGTPLSEAAELGYSELVHYLLSHGAKLRLPGQTEPALHSAVRGAVPSIVGKFLAAGASLDETNSLRETALHVAAESDDRVDCLVLLLDQGANVMLRRIFDQTALDVAIDRGSERCAAILIAHGASRNGANAA